MFLYFNSELCRRQGFFGNFYSIEEFYDLYAEKNIFEGIQIKGS